MAMVEAAVARWGFREVAKVAGIVLAVVFLVVVIVTAALWMSGWRVGKAQQKAETAQDGRVSAEQGAAGERAVQDRAAQLHITLDQARSKTDALDQQARAAPDGEDPLPPDSLARLRSHDEFLCSLRPAVCAGREGGDAAQGRDAGGGQTGLPAVDPAQGSRPDPG